MLGTEGLECWVRRGLHVGYGGARMEACMLGTEGLAWKHEALMEACMLGTEGLVC